MSGFVEDSDFSIKYDVVGLNYAIKEMDRSQKDWLQFWIDLTALATEFLDFKSQFLEFIVEEYAPRVHLYDTPKALFIVDVLWDIQGAL